jgi:hypothetical protein
LPRRYVDRAVSAKPFGKLLGELLDELLGEPLDEPLGEPLGSLIDKSNLQLESHDAAQACRLSFGCPFTLNPKK